MNNPNNKDKTPTSTKFAITNELQISDLKTQTNPSETAILIYLQLRRLKKMAPATRKNIMQATHLSHQNIDRALTQLEVQGKIKHITPTTPPITLKTVRKSQPYSIVQTTQHQQSA